MPFVSTNALAFSSQRAGGDEGFRASVIINYYETRAGGAISYPRFPWNESILVESQLGVFSSNQGILKVNIEGNAKPQRFLKGAVQKLARCVETGSLNSSNLQVSAFLRHSCTFQES